MLKATLSASAAAMSPGNAFAAVDEPAADAVSAADAASSAGSASLVGSGTAPDPVKFWNDRAVDLVVLDHTITVSTVDDTVAIGPAASSRALGVIHAVIADAASYAYKPPYKAQFNKTSPGSIRGDRGLFVGGAAYAIMKYIYSPSVFSDIVLNGATSQFMTATPGSAAQKAATWAAGMRFGNAKAFTRLWNEADVKARLRSDPAAYTPPPARAHIPDPWNCQQGFYGQKWGSITPLVLTRADVGTFAENELKTAPPIYQDELDLLVAKGSRIAKDAGRWPARTLGELSIGLFWAYDGTRFIGTPPLLLNCVVRAVADGDNLGTPATARLLALCHLAMADAAVVAWEAKWRVALWRPVAAIQALTAEKRWQPYGSPRSNRGRSFSGLSVARVDNPAAAATSGSSLVGVDNPAAAATQNTADTLLGASPNNAAPPAASPVVPGAYCLSDPEYSAAAFTPNFPSYPSGHTTFGGACFNSLLLFRSQRGITNPNTVNVTVTSAELDHRTTDNYDPSLTRPDSPITFTSVVEANPAQIDLGALTGSIDASRILLGVHWSFDETDGDTAGRRVGDIVHSRAYAVR